MKVNSRQYIVDRKRWGLFLFAFLLFTIYYLLSTPTPAHAQEVDLLWQGETYVSPFYNGRSLWSKQSKITLVAIPSGLGNQANLAYRWIKNGTVLGSLSGVGKNTLTYIDTVLSRPQVFRVEVLAVDDYDSPILAEAFITLAPINPTLFVYESHPLYGFMFHREVGSSYQFKEKETTFTAFPFFFSAVSRASDELSYQWQTNGTSEVKNSVTYRTPEEGAGSSQIQVRVSNAKKIMQSANKSFLVEFGQNENSN